MAEKDIFVHCLNSAFAMENALIGHLSKRAQEAPVRELKERVEQHAEETRRHADTVSSLLTDLGEAPRNYYRASVHAAVEPGMLEKTSGMMRIGMEVRLLLAGPSDIAIEHYEDGMYAAIVYQANKLGHSEFVDALEQIRREEQEMARFLEGGAPKIIDHVYGLEARQAG